MLRSPHKLKFAGSPDLQDGECGCRDVCGDTIAERINGDYGCSEVSAEEAIAAPQVGIAECVSGDYESKKQIYPTIQQKEDTHRQ